MVRTKKGVKKICKKKNYVNKKGAQKGVKRKIVLTKTGVKKKCENSCEKKYVKRKTVRIKKM